MNPDSCLELGRFSRSLFLRSARSLFRIPTQPQLHPPLCSLLPRQFAQAGVRHRREHAPRSARMLTKASARTHERDCRALGRFHALAIASGACPFHVRWPKRNGFSARSACASRDSDSSLFARMLQIHFISRMRMILMSLVLDVDCRSQSPSLHDILGCVIQQSAAKRKHGGAAKPFENACKSS